MPPHPWRVNYQACPLDPCFPGRTHTPGLHVNGSLTLAIGFMKPLDFSLLNVQDQDGRVEDLLFHVVSTPTNGQLVLLRNGKEVQLDKAGHFSWKDVKEKRVRFVHSKEKPRWLCVPLFSSCLLSTSALHLPHSPSPPTPFSPQLSLLLWERSILHKCQTLSAACYHFTVIAQRVCFC